MAMQDLMHDTVRLIKSDGQRFDDIKASVQRGKVFTADPNIPIEEGDVFERDLPSGVIECFRVTDPGYYSSTGGIPAHYQTRVQKITPAEGQRLRNQSQGHNASKTKLFISYRRADAADVTGRIRDRLAAHVGAGNVFMDVESIDLGKDFRDAIASAITAFDAVLVIMCPSWLDIADQSGRRRLENEHDPVRVEIETALMQRKRVIPLLAGGATMPAAEDLPESIRSFAFLNGLRVRPDPDFDNDMGVLLRAVDKMPDAG